MMNMTPQQKIKWLVCSLNARQKKLPQLDYPVSDIDKLYDVLVEKDLHWDALSELRYGTIETDIECESSRHYESKSVAAQLPDGSWVGWTYWYGGGKHARPEEIDWVGEAYNLNCAETEIVTIKRKFTKISCPFISTQAGAAE